MFILMWAFQFISFVKKSIFPQMFVLIIPSDTGAHLIISPMNFMRKTYNP